MSHSVNQLVTVERFEAGIAMLQARIDELHIRIDAVRTDLRAEIARAFLIAVGITIAANALMMTVPGIVLTGGASL